MRHRQNAGMNDRRLLTGAALLVAPIIAAWFVARDPGPVSVTRGLTSLVVLAMFSPLFFSVPALVTQHARDRALPGVPNPARAVLLIPNLLFSPRSTARFETLMSVAGFAAALSLLGAHAAVGIHAIW